MSCGSYYIPSFSREQWRLIRKDFWKRNCQNVMSTFTEKNWLLLPRVQNEDLSLEHFPCWVRAPALLSWESSELPRISHCSVCPVFFQLQKCQLKKKAQCESCKLSFIWGKNEDCRLGDCTSASSEKLLQRGREESSARMWFWWRGNMCNQAYFSKRCLLVLWSFC